MAQGFWGPKQFRGLADPDYAKFQREQERKARTLQFRCPNGHITERVQRSPGTRFMQMRQLRCRECGLKAVRVEVQS